MKEKRNLFRVSLINDNYHESKDVYFNNIFKLKEFILKIKNKYSYEISRVDKNGWETPIKTVRLEKHWWLKK